MSPIDNQVEATILKLQQLKNEVLNCTTKNSLISKIDQTLEVLFGLGIELSGQTFPATFDMQRQVRYLRELRPIAQDLDEEQLKEFCREVGIYIGSMQFQLWPDSNESLFALLESD